MCKRLLEILLDKQQQNASSVSTCHQPKTIYSMTRRDMESTFGRFWRYQDSRITLFPLDAEQPRLGGRVQATEYAIDFRTLTPSMITYFGVYGEDFITYAEFSKDANPDDEATLLKIFEEGSDVILDKHSWKFGDDQRITYSRELNE